MLQAVKAMTLGFAAALLVGSAAAAQAAKQDGDYAGVLKAGGQSLHLLLHVTTGKEGPTAVLDSIDQNASIPASAYQADGDKASILFLAIGGELEGQFSPDRKTFSGAFKQGLTMPITLTRVEAAPAKP